VEAEIKVTPYDIKNGDAGNIFSCPVALAVNRALKDDATSRVGVSTITIVHDGGRHTIVSSSEVCNWIHQYDTRKKVEPCTFTLEIPEKFLETDSWTY
jgi:hypothetical protein